MSRFVSIGFPVVAIALSLVSVGCGDSASSGTDAGAEVSKPATPDGSPDTNGPGVIDGSVDSLPDASPADVVISDTSGGIDAQPGSTPDGPSVFDTGAMDATSPDGAGTGSTDVIATPLLDGSTGVADVLVDDGGIDSGVVLPPADAANNDAVVADAATTTEAGNGEVGSSWQKLGVVGLQESIVYMSVVGMPMTVVASNAVAAFGLVPGTAACDTTTVGDCQFNACSPSESSPNTDYLSAGTVTITGLDTDLPLTSTSTNGAYMSANYTDYLWTSSRPVTVTVTGSSDVPAFTLATVAPNPIVVTSPVPTASSPLMDYTISRATDLAVTWTGGVEGRVTVYMGDDKGSIYCSVDASKGTLSVPAAFMSKLTGAEVSFEVVVANSASKAVGEWTMSFSASTTRNPGTVTFAD